MTAKAEEQVRELYPPAAWGHFWKGVAEAASLHESAQELWLEYVKSEGCLLPTAWFVEHRPEAGHPGRQVGVMIQARVTCTCPGFEYRGACRHSRSLKEALATNGDLPDGIALTA